MHIDSRSIFDTIILELSVMAMYMFEVLERKVTVYANAISHYNL